MKQATKKTIRCAIYTRKSCEEGLEQEFNSLDAQREACESFIKSQQHEGWIALEKHYNDGGFSGGTLERPALKQLFEDIGAGKVDTVVVYKIDRLTRSLMDFSKIVELFDKKEVTFVSITQQFNTTTSMGRLTLNILLSFAQFEREVTGERIRDKIAASKKKGMWAGGSVAIGYRLENKKLVPDHEHVPTVQTIFEKYCELGSVQLLREYLVKNNIKTRAGKNFSKGNLYHILQNKVYIGLITHKDKVYDGEHQPIIDKEIFEKAQVLLSENRIKNRFSENSKNPSLLAGKIFDDRDNYMSPSHSNKKGKRYRYYVSQAILQYKKNEAGSVSKIPAGQMETFVVNEISRFVFNRGNIQKYIENFDVHKQKDILDNLKSLKINLEGKLNPQFIRSVINKIILHKDKVEIILCQEQLIKVLESITYGSSMPEEAKGAPENIITLSIPIQITSTPRKGSVVIVSEESQKEPNINPQLIKAIARSYHWNNLLCLEEARNCSDIKEMENLKDYSYITEVVNLRFLAPDIIENILNGTQPQDLTIQKLFNIKSLDWSEQRKLLKI